MTDFSLRQKKYEIRLSEPATKWDDGVPIGNGRLGAMVLGKPDEEMIYINEETIWYGADRDRKNPDFLKFFPEVRRLLLQGEVQKAQFLAKMAMTSTPKYENPYQPAGNMRICFYDHKYSFSEYSRCLDLNTAVCKVQYQMKDVIYEREHLVSHAHQVLAVKLNARYVEAGQGKEGGLLNFCVNMSRKPFEENTEKLDEHTVCGYGRLGEGGIRYFAGIRLVCKGGSVHTIGDFAYVTGAKEAYIYLACTTDYQDQEYRNHCLELLDTAENIGYDLIFQKHVEEYQALFSRIDLQFGEKDYTGEDTAELLKAADADDDRAAYLTELLFHYGRYLLISSSYDCLLPANLQGIWNGEFVPPWLSEFTININTQMNYWMAEKCNLSECHLPLFAQINRMLPKGKETAQKLYGCEGFCAHHNTNIWGNTDPEGILDASPIWPMGGAWLALHLYEHYDYVRDRDFLVHEALPIMREAIRFFEKYLYQTEDGMLITGPTTSPENTYISKLGVKGSLCMGASMDSQILRQLFTYYLEGIKESEGTADEELMDAADKVRQMLNALPPITLTKDGRIREWMEDYEETEPGHRHISHLFALHPGSQITEKNEELFSAARKTLEYRLENGGGHTGWSCAWIGCFWARLKDGDKVWKTIKKMLRSCIQTNLLDTHPPFQIDGNFGIADCIAEMLLQDHAGYVELLPALPENLAGEGHVHGMAVRGGIQADFSWYSGKLVRLVFTAKESRTITWKWRGVHRQVYLPAGCQEVVWDKPLS